MSRASSPDTIYLSSKYRVKIQHRFDSFRSPAASGFAKLAHLLAPEADIPAASLAIILQLLCRCKVLGKLHDQEHARSCSWSEACLLGACRDSHTRTFFHALACFFIDMWDHQECQPGTDSYQNGQLFNIRFNIAKLESPCLHLPGMTRICLVKAVHGSLLTNNDQVRHGVPWQLAGSTP
jgi:hypothetical protein